MLFQIKPHKQKLQQPRKDIKNRFIVSIVDNTGAKQFSTNRFIKQIILYFLASFIILSCITLFIIKVLSEEVIKIREEKDQTQIKYDDTLNKNNDLEQLIEINQHKLNSINKKIIDLEEIINLNNQRVDEQSFFDLENLTQAQKNIILKIVPNGAPVESSVIISTSKDKNGLSIKLSEESPVYASADGIVDLSRNDIRTSKVRLGNFAKITHSFGFDSLYANLSRVEVKRGDIIKKGQIIGYSKDKKLFYDVRFLGQLVDLDLFIKWDANNFYSAFGDNVVNWENLFWALEDIMQINNHKILQHNLAKLP